MSYPRKPAPPRNRSLPSHGSQVQHHTRMTEQQREKLVAIHQREQLKGMLVSKFLEKYGPSKGLDPETVKNEVANFMKNEKLTEENLRRLEHRIKDGSLRTQPSNVSNDLNALPHQHQNKTFAVSQSVVAHPGELLTKTVDGLDKTGLRSGARPRAQSRPNSRGRGDDELSVTSKAKSIYLLGDEEDEWATMIKYDQELYKKEKEIEKLRSLEMKKKIKAELDRQVEERKKAQEKEKSFEQNYTVVLNKQCEQFDEKVRQKSVEVKNKIWTEKLIRDKQLLDESIRKRVERKTEKEIEETMVKKIQNDIDADIRAAAERRRLQKENLKRVLEDHEIKRLHDLEDKQLQKALDLKEQEEYNKLQETMEKRKLAEIKAREEKNKMIRLLNADNIMTNHRNVLDDEERKFLNKSHQRELKLQEEDRQKKQREADQKAEMRRFLDKQLQEREFKKQVEKASEIEQAEIWKKDVVEYENHEKHKHETVKKAHLDQADFLKKQMEEEKARLKKMSAQEALLNKQRLKEMAERENNKFHRMSLN